MVISLRFPRCLGGSAFICAVSLLAASEAKSLPDAPGSISWRELFQTDGVDIHGIGILGSELEENKERGKPCPFLRAMIQAFRLWKLVAFSIQALRVVGTFSME